MNRIFSMVMWTGKAMTFFMGLAVVLALTLAVAAGTAEAAKAKSLQAGVENAVSAVTSMAGSVAGPVLRLDNNSAASGATALDLQVESGKAPLTVNPTAGKATNLDADELDGKDSSSFLGKTEKAADANKLDGKDSTDFVQTFEPIHVVAAGQVFSDGTIRETTANVGSVQRISEGRYTIDILTHPSFDHGDFVPVTSAITEDRVAHPTSFASNFLVETVDMSGNKNDAAFTFVVYDVS